MSEKLYSSRLLNYVERVDVAGYPKTAFYTELNTNLKPGDKVFILNGNYDSDTFVDQDRYAKYVDGYRILSIDNCRVVLDIDYTGAKSYETDNIDNFIKVWHVRNLRDWLYLDTVLVDTYNDRRVSKFEWKLTNNIVFSDDSYGSIVRPDSSTFSVSATSSFWAKNGNGINQPWVNINSDFNLDTFALSPTASGAYFGIGYTINNNNRLFIYNEDFTYNDTVFKQRNIYKYEDGKWIIDIKYKQPIISKLNFRDGSFKGNHHDGIFGTNQKSLNWIGTYSNWQSGVLVNSTWVNGNLNSKSTSASQSFYAAIDVTGLPIQTSDFSNNNGQGYNYILDSDIVTGEIADGNFINCNVGLTASPTFSAVDDYYSPSYDYKLKTKGGYYNFCDIYDSKLSDTVVFDSRVYNSTLNQTRMLNSQFFDSVADGEFNSDSGIKVTSADIYSYIPKLIVGATESDSTKIRGVLKLFISDQDLLRLDSFDSFYVTKINKGYVINSLTSDQKIILPYETKYILDRFHNSEFSQQQFNGAIKNSSDNKYKPFVVATSSFYWTAFQLSGNTQSSIDIDLGYILGHFNQGGAVGVVANSVPTYSVVETSRVINLNNVNNLFSGTFISNSDFSSGILKDTTWVSGAMINRQSNIIGPLNDRLSISINGSNLDVQTSGTFSYLDGFFKVNKNIWLDSIYNDPGVKSSIQITFGKWSYLGTSSESQGATFSTPIGTFSFVVPSGTSYGSYTSDYILNSVIPILDSTSMYSYYTFESVSTPSESILNIKSKYVGASYSITSATSSVGASMSFSNNVLGANYVGTNISGRYQIQNIQNTGNSTTLTIKPMDGLNVGSLTSNVFFFDQNTNPNYISIHQTLFKSSIIQSGLFKRNLISYTVFFNESFDNTDKSLNPNNIDNLRISKSIFKNNNNNNIKSGLLYNSHFFGGTWENGIAYQSIWSDSVFYNGIFKSGYWKSGIFKSGKFIESGSVTQSSISFSNPNEYLNWMDGEFQSGEFESSVWRSGTFSNGKFYNSDWYAGTWENGILGDKNLPYAKTTMGNKPLFNEVYGMTYTVWEDGVVDNAIVGGSGSVHWYSGKFNSGLFTSFATGSVTSLPYDVESTWYNGEFNGGEFSGLAKWKDGDFNNGLFISWYGWNKTSSTSSDYGWEKGNFNGGQFGNGGYATNSTWYDGVFNNGIFSGRVWNNGIFNKGNFIGGATWSPRDYENEFVQSFTNSFYGLWKDGIVIDSKSNIPSDQKIWGISKRAKEMKRLNVDVKFKNALWLNGTFSSTSATFDTSAWLSGRFSNGKFINSIFNPYVSRDTGQGSTASLKVNVADDPGGDWIISSDQYISWTAPVGGYMFTILGTTSFTPSVDPLALYNDQILSSYNESINLNVKSDYNISFTASSFFILTSKVMGRDYNFNSLTFSSPGYQNTSQQSLIVGTDSNTRSFDRTDNCVWNNGEFISGNFYFSKWNDGVFQNGTMSGGIWRKGTWNYGDANNVYWESGLWRNGNWDGAPFGYLDDDSDMVNDLMTNVARYAGTGSVFVNNALQGTYGSQSILNPTFSGTASTATFSLVAGSGTVMSSGWSYSNSYSDGAGVINDSNVYVDLDSTLTNTDLVTPANSYDRGASVPLLFLAPGGTTSIFTQSNTYYEIEFDIRIESDTNGGAFIEIWTGPKLSYQSYHDGVDPDNVNSPTFSTIKISWQPTASDLDNGYLPFYESIWNNQYLTKFSPLQKTLRLRARSADGVVNKCLVRILRASVLPISNIVYSQYNNSTVLPWGNSVPAFDTALNMPAGSYPTAYSFVYPLIVDNNLVSINYGNGTFKTGIWENGVWNNGNRNDLTKKEFRFISANAYIVSNSFQIFTMFSNKWTITLETKDNLQIQGFSVGDVVSIGNIVGYDYNNVRTPIKNTYTISKITSGINYAGTTQSQSRVEFTLQLNYRLRYITIDSNAHLVYVSKSIWKSGVFLNGYFNGVWNYGLIKGFPRLTKIENTQMIDGIFDGGHFTGATGTYVNYSNSANSGNRQLPYNKSLVQNFIFRDNNTAGTQEFNFESWMDVNYNQLTMVNLYSDNKYYDETFELERSTMNWNGYPTIDVLNSTSTFRDVDGTQSRSYKLGTKYIIYNDFIKPKQSSVRLLGRNFQLPSNIQFNKPFDNTIKYKVIKSFPVPVIATYSLPGMDNFYIDGWTISTFDYVFMTYSNNVISSSSIIPSQYFYKSNILATQSLVSSSFTVKGPTSTAKNINILNNDLVNLESNRYSIIDFDLDYYTGNATYSESIFTISGYIQFNLFGRIIRIPQFSVQTVSYPSLYFFNKPNDFSPNKQFINQLTTPGRNKVEYYYNRTDLNMSFWSINQSVGGTNSFGTASFSKIKMYEVDMIPFFQYYTQSNIDLTIKSPYRATAPFIDYTKSTFNFVDNVSVTVERVPTNVPPQTFEFDYIYAPFTNNYGQLTVICTELNRQGYLSGDLLMADEEFGMMMRDTQPEVMLGYHTWAAPIISKMQKSKSFTKAVWFFAKPWATQMAYEMGAVEKGSLFGKVLMSFGIWMSRKVGNWKVKKDPNLIQNYL
jgi:hypothetical protein